MEVIKKSDILDSYNYDGYSGSEIIGMIVYDEIPTIKAIPLDEIKQAREKIILLDSLLYRQKDNITEYVNINKVLGILDRLIKNYEREEW